MMRTQNIFLNQHHSQYEKLNLQGSEILHVSCALELQLVLGT